VLAYDLSGKNQKTFLVVAIITIILLIALPLPSPGSSLVSRGEPQQSNGSFNEVSHTYLGYAMKGQQALVLV